MPPLSSRFPPLGHELENGRWRTAGSTPAGATPQECAAQVVRDCPHARLYPRSVSADRQCSQKGQTHPNMRVVGAGERASLLARVVPSVCTRRRPIRACFSSGARTHVPVRDGRAWCRPRNAAKSLRSRNQKVSLSSSTPRPPLAPTERMAQLGAPHAAVRKRMATHARVDVWMHA